MVEYDTDLLKERRLALGKTYEQLHAELGYSISQIRSYIEGHVNNVDVIKLSHIAGALGFTLEDIGVHLDELLGTPEKKALRSRPTLGSGEFAAAL